MTLYIRLTAIGDLKCAYSRLPGIASAQLDADGLGSIRRLKLLAGICRYWASTLKHQL